MTLPVTGATAGYLGLLCGGLGLTVGLRRFFTNTLAGTGTDAKTGEEIVPSRWIRAQQNAAEQIPIFLILLATMECNKTLPRNRLATLGAVYCVARTAHSLSLFTPKVPTDLRVVGFLTQIGLCVSCSGILFLNSIKEL